MLKNKNETEQNRGEHLNDNRENKRSGRQGGKDLTKKRPEPLKPGDQGTETRQKSEDRTHLFTGYYIPRQIIPDK